MPAALEYRYVIDAFTPDTLPMARLAEYMHELADLLGEQDKVHFDRLEKGSAVLVSKVERVAAPKVATRVQGLRDGTAPEDVRKAFRQLDTMLAYDNAVGKLVEAGAEVIEFPGRLRPKPQVFGPFNQEGTLDGRLVRIGGRTKDIRALLDDGHRVYPCTVTKDQAKRLAAHLFEIVRVAGRGRWTREADGKWKLHGFKVFSFEVLDDRRLSEVVAELRAVPGNEWREIVDPYGELASLRGNDD
ncbi:MAG: hypothetical protein HY765_10605 [Rhodomicrobium sp.]|nr:hypothetical protein [Rhodomicrobium sp.]